jgi:uncharacterized membrane protein YdjX (TVP38/TMEM64 family)
VHSGNREQLHRRASLRMKPYLKSGAGLVALGLVIWFLSSMDAGPLVTRLLEWVQDLGLWGPVVFMLAYIIATVLMFPGAILTLAAGFIFGVVQGAIMISIASTLGATLAFLISRYFARDWVAKKIEGNPKFHALDHAVGKEGWKIVLLIRLSPVIPFNVLNYAFGLTRVSLSHYFFPTWLGMFPATLFYVYIGSLAGSLATLGEQGRTPLEWAYYAAGFIVALVAVIYLTRLARKVLNQKEIPA